jgi:hypothetical protein
MGSPSAISTVNICIQKTSCVHQQLQVIASTENALLLGTNADAISSYLLCCGCRRCHAARLTLNPDQLGQACKRNCLDVASSTVNNDKSAALGRDAFSAKTAGVARWCGAQPSRTQQEEGGEMG